MMVLALGLSSNGLLAQQNAVKVSLGNAFTGSIPLSFERAVSDNQSFAVLVNIGIPKNAPAVFSNEIEGVDGTGDIRTSSFSITPEYRFYTSGEAMNGFYIAPYLKYRSWGFDFSGTFGDDNTGVDTKGKWNAVGGGAQMGYQWLIGEHFVIDWYFLGLGMTYQTLKADFTTDDLSADLQQIANDIEADLDGSPILGNGFSAVVDGNSVGGKIGFLFPNVRTGISIGVAF